MHQIFKNKRENFEVIKIWSYKYQFTIKLLHFPIIVPLLLDLYQSIAK